MSTPQHAASTAKETVLVVGPQATHLNVLTRTLERKGCAVIRARGMEDWVLPLVRTVPIHLLFFDVEAEKGTYADLIEKLRREQRPTKIVVTSRLERMTDYLEAMQVGAYDFVSPPIEPGEVARLLHNTCASPGGPQVI